MIFTRGSAVQAESTSEDTVGLLGAKVDPTRGGIDGKYLTEARLLEIEQRILEIEARLWALRA